MTAIDPSDTIERARARIGSFLKDKWRLDDLIGSGGMASVFRATHRNGNRVAIKMLHLEYSLDAVIRRRFLREGYAANTVDHPDVVRALDEDVADDGSAFLVLELLEGESLQGLLDRGGSMPVGHALQIAHAILGVLAAAHAKGIVHRDVKPDNVFLTRAGGVKLLDFGIAQVRDASRAASIATAAGAAMGTPAFMAPEQALGHVDEVDARTDVWAVGAVVFTMLSGRHVHVARTQMEQLVMAATKVAARVADVVLGVPPEVAAIVDRALAFDRAARWPDARAMQAAIAAVAGQPAAQPAPRTSTIISEGGAMPMAPTLAASAPFRAPQESALSHPGLAAPTPRRARRAGVAIGATLVALLGAAGIYYATARGQGRAAGVASASPTTTTITTAAGTETSTGAVTAIPPPGPEIAASSPPPVRSAPPAKPPRGAPASSGAASPIVRTIPSAAPTSWLDQR